MKFLSPILVLCLMFVVGCGSGNNASNNAPVSRAEKSMKQKSLIWGDIVMKDFTTESYCRDSKDGQVCTMYWVDADSYCQSQNKRLPTVREQAEWAQAHGAKGIKETALDLKGLTKYSKATFRKNEAEKNKMRKKGYYAIGKQNAYGLTITDFYYNQIGYKRPSNIVQLWPPWTWSSSANLDLDYAYSLDVDLGYIGWSNASNDNIRGVRCVTDR